MNSILAKRILIVAVVVIIAAAIGYFIAAGGNLPDSPNGANQARVSAAIAANIDPAKSYPVTDVVDGDTFKVVVDGEEITVRMLGVNTPETVDPDRPPQCYGREASAKTKSLLDGGEAKLALNPDREKTDHYGRLLAYAYLADGMFLNEMLIEQGFAREYTVGKAYRYQSDFKRAENEARMAGRGLWGKCGTSVADD